MGEVEDVAVQPGTKVCGPRPSTVAALGLAEAVVDAYARVQRQVYPSQGRQRRRFVLLVPIVISAAAVTRAAHAVALDTL